MRRRFTLNDFEHSLKEHADEFKMIPSKRVWHGIYNDVHPGRRWPSVAVALLLMFTLVVVGHLNTHNGSHANNKYSKTSIADNHITSSVSTKSVGGKSTKTAPDTYHNAAAAQMLAQAPNSVFTILPGNEALKNAEPEKQTDDVNTISAANNENKSSAVVNNNNESSANSVYIENNSSLKNKSINPDTDGGNNTAGVENFSDHYFSSDLNTIADNLEINKEAASQKILTDNAAVSVKQNSTVEIKQLLSSAKNIKALLHKKKNERVSWTYYAVPAISNVIFKGKALNDISAASISPTAGVTTVSHTVLHTPALGLEAGIQLNYAFSERLKFITAFQLTYSGYKITSNEVHPTFTTLTLKDPKTDAEYSRNYVTHYGNGIGEAIVSLRNYSWQLSLPVGVQYKLFGNNKIQFNTTANVAPSLVLKSNAYMLSSGGNNYVNDPSLMRRWNAASNFGVFVSFTAGNLKWQLGPNVRYQWLSTYKSNYTVKEHLIDYGIRIAITK